MQAVHELGQGANMEGRAPGAQIMPRLGLDPNNPDHFDLYKSIARGCERAGYIRKVSNGYGTVAITREGKQYIERVL